MPKITINKTVEVPAGPYCDDCGQLNRRTESVGWEDGLGSPGSMTFYTCGAFNAPVRLQTVEDAAAPRGKWQKLIKLGDCAKQSV